ncbi:MAG TPA: YbjN domain-containing protein [Actinopolymorphaceae bacterium]
MSETDPASFAASAVESALRELGVHWEPAGPGAYAVSLPGERKLKTVCVLRIGARDLGAHAFVVRRPDENHEAFHRFLLERNLRLSGVAFAVDHLGDVHVIGSLPLHAVTTEAIDRLLGAVLSAADDHFNRLLELGFAGSIRREWAWRTAHGESTANLEAFRHLF